MSDRRTFNRADWQAAQAAWTAGEFSPEWDPWRRLAAERGIISPPSGTRWDQWDDDDPSQRAILIRTIRDAEELVARGQTRESTLLGRAIAGARTWSQVVTALIGGYAEMREMREERDDARIAEHRRLQPDRAEAKAIFERVFPGIKP